MADDVIKEQLIVDGDATKGVQALRSVADEAERTERRVGQSGSAISTGANKVFGFLDGIGRFIGKLGVTVAGGAALAEKGFSVAGAASGLLSARLLRLNPVVAVVAATLGVLVGVGARLGAQSDQADRLGKTWARIRANLAAPVANFLAKGFERVNELLQSPAAQNILRTFALLEALILQKLTPTIYGLVGAFAALIAAIGDLDFSHILDRVVAGFKAGAAKGVEDAGKAAGATWSQGFADEAAASLRDKAPDRLLRNIGDLGSRVLSTLIAGMTGANLEALSSIGAAIRDKLIAEVQKGSRTKISVIPALIGSETAVARALAALDTTGSNIEDVVGRARAAVATLGPEMQTFVEATIRGSVATKALADAQAVLTAKEADLLSLQNQLAAAQARQAQAAADLLPLSDKLRDDQQELAKLLIDQTDRREKLASLARQQADAEAEVARLEKEQAAALAALAPLRQAVTDATEKQHVAELAVRDAQDAMLPLQEKLVGLKEELASLTAQQAESEKQNVAAIKAADQELQATQTAISEAQSSRARAIEDEQIALDHVADKYAGQLAIQDDIIAAVDARWKAELDGAQAAFTASEKLRLAEERRNNAGLLAFAQQRAGAIKNISDPNQRIAALARINKAEAEFVAKGKDALEAARLQAGLDQDRLKTTEQRIAEEKKGATEEIARIQGLIADEKASIGERIKSLQEAARIQARSDADALAIAKARHDEAVAEVEARRATAQQERDTLQARVDAAQHDADNQQKTIDRLAREEELARRKVESSQTTLTNAETEVHTRTDGAITEAKTRRDSLTEQHDSLDKQLSAERTGLEERIAREQADLDLRKSKLEEQAEIENRPLAARVLAAQGDVTAAQTAATSAQTAADKFKLAADSSKARLDQEKIIADLIAEQRGNLDAIIEANKQSATGTGGRSPVEGTRPTFSFDQQEIDGFADKVVSALKRAVGKDKITLGDLFDFGTGIGGDTGIFSGVNLDSLPIIGGVRAKIREIHDAIKGTFDDLGGAVESSWTDLSANVNNFFNDPSSPLNQLSRFLATPVKVQFLDDLRAFLSTPVKLDWLDNLRTFLSQPLKFPELPDLGKWAQQTWTDVTKWFKQLLHDLVGASIVPDIIDGVIGEFKRLPEAVVGFAQDVWKGVTGKFGDVKNDLLGSGGLVPKTWSGITDAFRTGKDGLVGSNGLVPKVWDGITGAFKDGKDNLTGSGGAVPKLWGGITGAFNTGKDGLVGPSGAWTKATGALGTAWESAKTALIGSGGSVGGLWTGITTAFGNGKEAVIGPDGLWSKLTGGLPGSMGAAKDAVVGPDGALTNLWKQGTALFGSLKNDAIGTDGTSGLIGGLVKGTGTLFAGLPAAIFGGGGLLSSLQTEFGKLWSGIGVFLMGDAARPAQGKGVIGGLLSGIGTAFGGLVAGIFGGGGGEGQGHQSLLKRVEDGFSVLFDSLKIFLVGDGKEKRGLLDSLFAIGVQMGQGLIDGLKSMLRDIVKGLGDLAKLLPQPLKDFLGIQSPSTVFEQLGTDTMAGLQQGIEGGKQGVLGAASDAATALLTTFLGLFGPADQGGTLLWHLFHKDGGFFSLLSDRTRAALNFDRIEVWQASLVSLGETVVGALAKLLSTATIAAENTGKAIGNGIAAGIRSTIEAIAKAAADAVRAAIDAAKHEAGIASPARAFIPIGENSALGYIKGLLDKLPQVGQAAAALAIVAQRGLLASAAGFGELRVPHVAMPGAASIATVTALTAAGAGRQADRGERASEGVGAGTHIGHQNIGQQNNYFNSLDASPRQQEIQGLLTW